MVTVVYDYALEGVGTADSFSQKSKNFVVVGVYSQLFDAVGLRTAAGKHGHSWHKHQRIYRSFKAVLKLIQNSFGFKVPQKDISLGIASGHPGRFSAKSHAICRQFLPDTEHHLIFFEVDEGYSTVA